MKCVHLFKQLRMRIITLLLSVIVFTACQSQTLTSGGKLKPEQAIMDVQHYTIALTVNINEKSISGYTEIESILSQSAPTLVFDLLNDLTVEKTWVNGKQAPFTHSNNIITITPATPVNPGKALVKIQYGG